MFPHRNPQPITTGTPEIRTQESGAVDPGSVRFDATACARTVPCRQFFIHWSQTTLPRTSVTPYSLRAQEQPTASTLPTWDEVEAIGIGSESARQYAAGVLLDRVDRHGDLLGDLLARGQALPAE